MPAAKTCFVVCPIGAIGSETRVYANEMLAEVIRPAAERFGYTVLRADELPTPGLITPQVLELLVEAELVIVDLTYENPNVYYELALRHACDKPAIQILGGGNPVPFDIKDFRTIRFRLHEGRLTAGGASALRGEIVRQIESTESNSAKQRNPIAEALALSGVGAASGAFRVFPSPHAEGYNDAFYDYFTARIRAARTAIYITGDGFECADERGEVIARGFDEAFRVALARGVYVVRVQTKGGSSRQWEEMLGALIEEYPSTFEVVTLDDRGGAHMSSVCVIDPDSERECVVEIMIQTEHLFGIRSADIAGTALFVVGRRDLAHDMRRRIRNLCEGEQQHCYFAYGSNMDGTQMLQRCPSAEKLGVAFLADHALVFPRRGSYRPGGVASVQSARGKKVYGVVWRVASSDLSRLDEAEDPDAYKRQVRTTIGVDGSSRRAYVYRAIPEGEFFPPDEDYLKLMVDSAVAAGLPKSYIETLRNTATA